MVVAATTTIIAELTISIVLVEAGDNPSSSAMVCTKIE
jgi:hypothetical protein